MAEVTGRTEAAAEAARPEATGVASEAPLVRVEGFSFS